MLFNCNNLFWDFIIQKLLFNPSGETEFERWVTRLYSAHTTWVFARKAQWLGHLHIRGVQRVYDMATYIWLDHTVMGSYQRQLDVA